MMHIERTGAQKAGERGREQILSVLAAAKPASEAVDPDGGPVAHRFLTVEELGVALGYSAATLYREAADGGFPAIRIRARWVIPARAVTAIEAMAMACRERVRESDWDAGWEYPGRRPFLWLIEAADLLRTSLSTLKREIAGGRFPARRGHGSHGRWQVPTLAIDAMERRALETWGVVRPVDFVTEPGQRPLWLARGGAA